MKDFAIKYNQNEAEQMKKMSLSDCVKKYMKDGETKELLLRTTWIGNDFAHCENTHEKININDWKE